jgi:TolA-binding protein
MKNIVTIIFSLVLLTAFSVAAVAQTKMSPQLCTNIGTCAGMMQEMTEALKSGKLSPAETQEVISQLNQMARIMKEMSAPEGPNLEQQHARELEQIKKKWDRLREMRRSMMPTKP